MKTEIKEMLFVVFNTMSEAEIIRGDSFQKQEKYSEAIASYNTSTFYAQTAKAFV